MRIVFHGENAAAFEPGFQERLDAPHQVQVIPDLAYGAGESSTLAMAGVVVGEHYDSKVGPLSARLYPLPAAGLQLLRTSIGLRQAFPLLTPCGLEDLRK